MGKILVIDDTPFWREIAADALRGPGHTVMTAADGVDGLNTFRAKGADLIVLDMEMPRLTGFSFLKQVRMDAIGKTLPVIILTGDIQKEDIIRAKKLGVVDYLLKSRFDVPGLLDRVQKRLGAKPLPQPAVVPQAAPTPTASPVNAAGVDPAPLLSRQHSLDRVEKAMQGRTLSGVANNDTTPDDATAPLDLDAIAGMHFLVAEDNELNQFVTQETLRRAGCTCDMACDGIQAVDAFKKRAYDAILMDCQMPNLDGLEATRRIRRIEASRQPPHRTPIIALTADAISGDRDKCLAAGMNGYVTKPIQPEKLFREIVREILHPPTPSDLEAA